MKKITYLITALGAQELKKSINTVVTVSEIMIPNPAHWQPAKLFNVVEERLGELPNEKTLKMHTKWICQNAVEPIRNNIFGTYINDYCHIRPAYDPNYFKNLEK